MTTKVYKSRTCIAINVVLASKKNRHISFEPCTDGSSSFTTSSPELQEAIEKHYNYRKLFYLESCIETKKADKKKPAEDDDVVNDEKAEDVTDIIATEGDIIADNENTEDDDETDADNITKVNVPDIEAAKDYLADTFGISRTLLRSKKAIMEQAKAHNIEFVGLS